MNPKPKFPQLTIPLGAKLTLAMTSLVILSIGSSTWASIDRNHKIFRQELEQQADVLLTTLSISTADSLYFGNVQLVQNILDELTLQNTLLSSRAYQQDGRIIADTAVTEQDVFTLEADAFGKKILASKTTLFEWQSDRLLAAKPIILGDEAIGAIVVELSTVALKQKNHAERNQSIILSLILVTVGIVISRWLSKSITEPLIQLTRATEDLSFGELDNEIEIRSNDELAILANAFNVMTAKLKELINYLEESERFAYQQTIQLKSTLKELQEAKNVAEAANHAKSKFLSNMSHELRTPLNGILGYAQILRRDRSLTPKQIKGIHTIYDSGSHLLTLINDILDLSKIEAGKLELVTTDIHLRNFVQGIVGIMTMQAQLKNLEFDYRIQSSIPVGIKADEKRLRQILLNLLGNAIKFTDYGKVTLNITVIPAATATKVKLPAINQTILRFEVIDTGVGINNQQIAKIFQPFEQVGDVKRRIAGTGLGLSITRQLVELMAGKLQVESKLGQGSRFWVDISFPVVQKAIARESSLETKPLIIGYKGSRRQILIADDHEANRLVLLNMLQPLGFEIFIATNGQQEVELAQKIKPDCILTDLVMPIKTGLEAIKEIRQIPQLQQVIIIAISASILNYEDSQSLGCEAFLAKPVAEDKLLSLLQQHLSLSWLYENLTTRNLSPLTDKTAKAQNLVVPPVKELESLYELAMFGSMRKIRQWAITLKELDAKYEPFSTKVKAFADSFEEKAIISLVEQYLPHK